MSVANAYFYSEKPLHARHTPHASARHHSSSSAELVISGRGVGSRGGSSNQLAARRIDVTATTTTTATQRKVRRVHATTTSLPEYRTLSTSPREVASPKPGGAVDAPLTASTSDHNSRVAYILYTPQGPKPLATLSMSLAGGTAPRQATRTGTSKSGVSAVTLPSALTLSPHMIDRETHVRCLYVKEARSQLLYIPPGATVDLCTHATSGAAQAGSPASSPPLAPPRGSQARTTVEGSARFPLSGRRTSFNGGAGSTTSLSASARHTNQAAADHESTSMGTAPRVLGIQLCLSPDPPESASLRQQASPGASSALTIECLFSDSSRLVLSNTVTGVSVTSAQGGRSGPSAGGVLVRVPLQSLRVGRWTLVCLDLESLQRSLFPPSTTSEPSAPASRASPRAWRRLRVTCGPHESCGVFIRRVVAMPAMPTTRPPRAESAVYHLSVNEKAHTTHLDTVVLPDALRMSLARTTLSGSTKDTHEGTETMSVLLVRTGYESALTAGDASADEVRRVSAGVSGEGADGEGLSGERGRAVDDTAPPPPPPLPPAPSTSPPAQPGREHTLPMPPTAFAQLRALLEVEERDADRVVSGATSADRSGTVDDVYETLSAPSPPPATPEQRSDFDEEGSQEQFLVRHAKALDGGSGDGEPRPPRHRASAPIDASTAVHALEASVLVPTPRAHGELTSPPASSPPPSPSQAVDMVAVMRERVQRIQTVLRSGSRAQASRRTSPFPTGTAAGRRQGVSPPPLSPPRAPSASPSEDKAVQTDDAWCALDHMGSRSAWSNDASATSAAARNARGRTTPLRAECNLNPSHHYIPLSALKDQTGRPPHSSATFFARPSNLFSIANADDDDDGDDSKPDDEPDSPVFLEAVPATAGRPTRQRVLYHGDTPTPTLTSLTPATTDGATDKPTDANVRRTPFTRPLSSSSARAPPPLTTKKTEHGPEADSGERWDISPSQPRSATSQGMTGSTQRGTTSRTPDRATPELSTAAATSVQVATPGDAHTEAADGADDLLTRRVLDFWSSTEHPLRAAAVVPSAAVGEPSGSRPGTTSSRHSHRSRRYHHRHSRRNSRDGDDGPLAVPGSARHDDPSAHLTATTGRRHDVAAAAHHTESKKADRLVFNSAQYESAEAWVASLETSSGKTSADAATTATRAARHDQAAARAAAVPRAAPLVPPPPHTTVLPSHRSVFAKLRQHLNISSESEVSATSATSPPCSEDARESHTAAERSSSVCSRKGPGLGEPRGAHDPATLSTTPSAARTSWTFQSTSLVLGSGQSTTHPWASSRVGDAEDESEWTSTSFRGGSEAAHRLPTHHTDTASSLSVLLTAPQSGRAAPSEALPVCHRPSAGAAAAASAALAALHNSSHSHVEAVTDEDEDTAPPPPPRFSLYASGGPIVVPPTPQPFGRTDEPAPDAALDAALSPSVAYQRAEATRRAEVLASRDAVRLGNEPMARWWSDEEGDVGDGASHVNASLSSPSAQAHEGSPAAVPTTEKRGTPLQWPLLRRSRMSSTPMGSHPRPGSSRPLTGAPTIPAATSTATDPPAATQPQAERINSAHASSATRTVTTAVRRSHPLDAAANTEEEPTQRAAVATADAAASSPTPLSSPFTCLAPASVLPAHGATSPQATRYAGVYSSCTSSLAPSAPSAHANGSTCESAAPTVVLQTPTDSSTAAQEARRPTDEVPAVATRPTITSTAPTSHPQLPLHRHYSLPHLAQYHRLASAGPVQVRPSQSTIQAHVARANSAVPRLSATNAAPEILLSPPHMRRGRSSSSLATAGTTSAAAARVSTSDRYMYDPVLDCYLDRHAHVYVEAEDIEL